MKKTSLCLIVLVAIHTTLCAAGLYLPGKRIVLSSEEAPSATHIVLEMAVTQAQLQWGLMGRKTLAADSGMLFDFRTAKPLTFWMFNCFVDMSLAFLDEQHVIREIYDLKAYPDEMDKARLVATLADFSKYPSNDPIVLFFKEKAVTSTLPSRYALEVAGGWFAEHHIVPGDVLLPVQKTSGLLLHTLDVGPYRPDDGGPVILEFPTEEPRAVSLPDTEASIDVAYLDASMKILHQQTLVGEPSLPPQYRDVAVSDRPAKFCIIAKKGWLQSHVFQKGLVVETIDR